MAFSAVPDASGPEQGLQYSPKSFSCTYQQDYNRLPLKTRSPGTKQQHAIVAISCSPALLQVASLPPTAHPRARSLPGSGRQGLAKQTTCPQACCRICQEAGVVFISPHAAGHQDLQGPAPSPAQAPQAGNQSRAGRMLGGEKGHTQVTKS